MKIKNIMSIFLLGLLLSSCSSEPRLPTDDTTAPLPDGFTYTQSDDKPLTCNVQNGSDDLQYCDGCLYFCVGLGTDLSPTVYTRYNCSTGNLTSVCPDPLCQHNTIDCPLYGIYNLIHYQIVAPNGKIYFLSSYFNRSTDQAEIEKRPVIESYMEYDPETMNSRSLEELNGAGFSNELYTDEYRFYHGTYYDEKTGEYISAIMRMSLADGKTEPFAGIGCELDSSDFTYADDLLFILGGRVYLTDSKTVYSVTCDGKDRVDHIQAALTGQIVTDGEYIFYNNGGEVCRRSLDGGGEERLGIFTQAAYNSLHITEKYIYYQQGEDVVLGKARIYGYASDTVTLTGGEFWRCRHDGSGAELVYKFDGDTAGLRPLQWLVAGDYIYCSYYWWTDADGDGVYREGDNGNSMPTNGVTACTILRIDVNTGKTYYIKAAK